MNFYLPVDKTGFFFIKYLFMANVRELKKNINNLCFDVISECVIFKKYSSSNYVEHLQAIASDAISLRNELIFKANHSPFYKDKKATKAYYRNIVEELTEKIISLHERMNALPEKIQPTKLEKKEANIED